MKEKIKHRFSVYGLVVGALLIVYSVIILAVLLWGFAISLKTQDEFFINAYPWFTEIVDGQGIKIDFKYIKGFKTFKADLARDGFGGSINLMGMFANSILYSLGCAIVSTLSPLVMAYVASKYRYRFSNWIPKIVLTVMVIPVVGATAATLQIVEAFGIFDTYVGSLILKAGFTSMYFLVFYSAFKNLSWEYAEAAFVDGASHVRVMFGIMIPLIMPIVFSVFLIFFVQYWNDYQTILTYYPSHPTAALGLFYYNKNSSTSSNETMLLTGCYIVTIPVLILFLIFRERLMGNLSVGGIKG